MSSARIFSFVFLISIFALGSSVRADCIAPTDTPTVLVEPTRPLQNDPLKIAVVLLRDYLTFVKKPKESVSVQLDVVPETGAGYRLVALRDGKRIDAPFVFPDTLNDALVATMETIAQDVKKPIKSKKILPFLNETPSGTAYLRYADGVLALERSDWLTAAAAFEAAIASDYNYVEAYSGLAEAQAAQGAATGKDALRVQSQTTLQKAKLLNPYRAKRHEERATWYWKASCGTNGRKGKNG